MKYAVGAFNQSILHTRFSKPRNIGLSCYYVSCYYVWGAIVRAFMVASVVIEFVQNFYECKFECVEL